MAILISTKERELSTAIAATLPLLACLTSIGIMWPPWPATPPVFVHDGFWKTIKNLKRSGYRLGAKILQNSKIQLEVYYQCCVLIS